MKKTKSTTAKCIYCKEIKEMSEEHYLPEGLGKFKNFETLDDRVCRDCNSLIGGVEEQFCRSSDIAFMRHRLGIKGKKKAESKKVNPFLRGSAGMGPLEMYASIPDQEYPVRVYVRDDGLIDYLPQFILVVEDDVHHLIITPDITEPQHLTDKIKAKFKEIGVEHVAKAGLIGPNDEVDRIKGLMSQLTYEWAKDGNPLPMTGKVDTNTKITVDGKHFRAIAKIAFHYFLKHTPDFWGDEYIFSGIRYFIKKGGSINDFVRWSDDQVIEDFKRGELPPVYMHALIFKSNPNGLFCELQFFVGPQFLPQVYIVRLGDNPGNQPRQSFGYQFFYYPDGKIDGFDGEMSTLLSMSREEFEANGGSFDQHLEGSED
jgi:hypothetical protein